MPHIVLPHESQEEYDSLEGVIVNRFKPADELEMDLVKEIAAPAGACAGSRRWKPRSSKKPLVSSGNIRGPTLIPATFVTPPTPASLNPNRCEY